MNTESIGHQIFKLRPEVCHKLKYKQFIACLVIDISYKKDQYNAKSIRKIDNAVQFHIITKDFSVLTNGSYELHDLQNFLCTNEESCSAISM